MNPKTRVDEIVDEDQVMVVGLRAMVESKLDDHRVRGKYLRRDEALWIVLASKNRMDLVELGEMIAAGVSPLDSVEALAGSRQLSVEAASSIADKIVRDAVAVGLDGDGPPPNSVGTLTGIITNALIDVSRRDLSASPHRGEGISRAEGAVVHEADEWERLRSAGPDQEQAFRDQVFALGAAVVELRRARAAAGSGAPGPEESSDRRAAVGKWFVKAIDDLEGSLGPGGPPITLELMEAGAAPMFDGPCHVYNFEGERWTEVGDRGRGGTTMVGLRDCSDAKLRFLRALATLPVKVEDVGRLIFVVYEPEARVGVVVFPRGRR